MAKNAAPETATPVTDAKTSKAWQNDASTKIRKMTEVTTDFRKFENVDDKIAGTLIARGVQAFDDKTVGRFTVQPDGGEKPVVFLGTTELDDKLSAIEIGTYIEITLVGFEKTGKGRPMKKFLVQSATS